MDRDQDHHHPVKQVALLRSATAKILIVAWIVSRTPIITLTVGAYEMHDIKNDDKYKNGCSEALNQRTITRMFTLLRGLGWGRGTIPCSLSTPCAPVCFLLEGTQLPRISGKPSSKLLGQVACKARPFASAVRKGALQAGLILAVGLRSGLPVSSNDLISGLQERFMAFFGGPTYCYLRLKICGEVQTVPHRLCRLRLGSYAEKCSGPKPKNLSVQIRKLLWCPI